MSALQAGSQAPDFSLSDRNGKVWSLYEALEGELVLLTFFKITCPTCQYALPFFDRLNKAIEGSGVKFWAISQNSHQETVTFNDKFEVDLPQLFDPEEKGFPVSNAYGITHVPSSFLVGQDGVIAVSSVSWDKSDFKLISKKIAVAASIPDPVVFSPGEDILDYRAG